MDLTSYIKSRRGNGIQLAAALDIGPTHLSQMASGYRAITSNRAALIEKHTNGAVSREEMLPHSWRETWPELAKAKAKKAKKAK